MTNYKVQEKTSITPRHWLVIWPTILFFAVLAYGINQGLTITLDSTSSLVSLVIGAIVGAFASWGAFR